ncbi:MAG: SUMF1/EgtB/PvdO family nonheme iron enzyme [Kiritimatiellae bacterium]|nr:SUMF1/EgtB/PvdO family nonheme iron enzyme [Kiritimatiellia bacterium]
MKKTLVFAALAALLVLSATAATRQLEATVSEDEDGFTVIGYTLAGDDPAVITFDVLTNGVSVGAAGVSRARGDVWALVQPGDGEIKWRADRDLPERVFEAGAFDVRVTAWPTNDPPDYMVIDLVTNATVRSPTVAYYPSAGHLPAGGLANRNYARSRLVMRKIPAANRRWRMGSLSAGTDHDVILTENYYVSIYELTDTQRTIMLGNAESAASYSEKPNVRAYNLFRGSSWPTGGASGAAGEIATYRAYTGIALDLPTEAQWEFAARGGEYYWDCFAGTNVVAGSENLAPMLDGYAWYGYNSQNASGVCALQPVGLLKPNAYGLYDVLGNAFEWCLDFTRSLPGPAVTETDPAGGSSGNRVMRGGCYNQAASKCTLNGRANVAPNNSNDGVSGVDGQGPKPTFGARLVCPAVAVK